MTPEENGNGHAALVDDLVARLEARGVPQGSWLMEITAVRRDLAEVVGNADSLLRRLQEAVIRGYEAEHLAPGPLGAEPGGAA